jgi:flagellar protein FliS
MAYKNAQAAYRDTRIKTASQGQLIIMLYDGILKNLDNAIELLNLNMREKKTTRIEQIGKAIIRAQEIITELSVSLDFEAGGDVAKNLYSLYVWFNHELLEASISRNAKRVLGVRGMVSDLRRSWADIAENSALASFKGSYSEENAGLNIAG